VHPIGHPLAQLDDGFEPRFARRGRKQRRAAQRPRRERRAEIGAGHALHRCLEIAKILQRAARDLGAGGAQPLGTCVDGLHQRTHRKALFQQSERGRKSGLAGRSGDEDARLRHLDGSGALECEDHLPSGLPRPGMAAITPRVIGDARALLQGHDHD
jgi:hypothetical protein